MIPRSWNDPLLGLTARDFRVAITLFSYGSTPDHPAFPSLDTVARVAKCSKRTVQRVLDRLVEKGLVTRTHRPGTTCVYTVANLTTRGGKIEHDDGQGSGHAHAQKRTVVHPLVHPLVKAEEEQSPEQRARNLQRLRELRKAHGL